MKFRRRHRSGDHCGAAGGRQILSDRKINIMVVLFFVCCHQKNCLLSIVEVNLLLHRASGSYCTLEVSSRRWDVFSNFLARIVH
ncbi:hypothetical protein V6N12_056731 [Hibiscus sabdariffa]|uniref:Uncharacterized protein n=1 Tax=Hibiscus sabdariffa TaxID=183260 RepID=A0ABR2DBW3_9ROSI